MTRSERPGRSRRRRPTALKRWVARILWGVVAGLVLALVSMWGLFAYYAHDLPTIETLRRYTPPQTTRIVDRNGEVLGEIFTERRTVVPMDRIPRVLVLSVLAAEDADFYRHEGLDYPGLLRAIGRAVVTGGRPRGTSTITQQVVKLLLLTPERSIERKIRELILARRIEHELSKDEILHLYLNHINFGHGRYGAQEAARFYFDKDVSELNLAEASLIAGIPQAPARLSPRTDLEAARARQHFVLSQLERKREVYWPDLSEEAIANAQRVSPTIVPKPMVQDAAPEVMALVRKTLRKAVGPKAYGRGGYTVHTTLDLGLQVQTREALKKGLRAVDARHGYGGRLSRPRGRARRGHARRPSEVSKLGFGKTYSGVVTAADDSTKRLELNVGGHRAVLPMESLARYNPKQLSASEFAPVGARLPVSLLRLHPPAPAQMRPELGPEGAAIVIDPRTRDVLALVGGYQAVSGFNRALDAVRQPGSTFKPIVYAAGIQAREYTPASIVLDAPVVYDEWMPQNYETWHYGGAVSLREALARSINVVAVRVMETLSPERVARFARALGIRTELEETLALALGASDVRLAELTNAYATFAAAGTWKPFRMIERVVGPDGARVPLREPSQSPRSAMTPAEAYVITDMLTSVVKSGTGAKAQALGRPVAGKTGTSNRARDAWFVGYTPAVVAGVWVGFDDHRPLGRKESGGRAALPIWMDIIRAAEGDRRPLEFAVPDGVVTANIDPATGLLAYEGMAEPAVEVFLEGTVPTEFARPPDVAAPDTFLMEQFGTTPSIAPGPT